MSLLSRWQSSLLEQQTRLQQAQLWRNRQQLSSAQGAVVQCDGEHLINFSSNDYLGLANHPGLIGAMQKAASTWGVGSGASHLVTGHQTPHHAFEQAIAEFVGAERALLFSTGYMANLAVQTALLDKSDVVLQDKLSHASLIDGAQLSAAKFKRYRHADVSHAESLLQRLQSNNQSSKEEPLSDRRSSEGRLNEGRLSEGKWQKCMIATDGVFSMDGNIAPLTDLKALADQQQALLYVDDAHGIGVVGEQGCGSLELANLQPKDNILLLGTLGKAFGSFGAFVAGDDLFIEQLIQSARSYIYTTSLPAAVVSASHAALSLIQEQGDGLRQHVNELTTSFKAGVEQLGLPLMASNTPIQPLVLGSASAAMKASQLLRENGFLVTAIRPPTVPPGSARLRFTFSAAHTKAQVQQLLDCLASDDMQALFATEARPKVTASNNDVRHD